MRLAVVLMLLFILCAACGSDEPLFNDDGTLNPNIEFSELPVREFSEPPVRD